VTPASISKEVKVEGIDPMLVIVLSARLLRNACTDLAEYIGTHHRRAVGYDYRCGGGSSGGGWITAMSRGDWTRYPTASGTFHRTAQWKRLRKLALARDHRECQMRGPRCTGTADTVDLIIPWHRGGVPELFNVQSACRSCHQLKTAAEATAAATAKRNRIRRKPVHPADLSRVGGYPLPAAALVGPHTGSASVRFAEI
jgi:5-methylcytosine-specific restriction enzyme A